MALYISLLLTATRFDNHLGVFLQDNIVVKGVVQDGYSGQLDGRTAGVGRDLVLVRDAAHDFHQRLHDRVVRGVQLGVEGEAAAPLAVVGVVALGGDDPVLPAQVAEGDVEVLHLAGGV